MSAITQQIVIIQRGISSGADIIHLNDTNVKLNPTCGTFITMVNEMKFSNKRQEKSNKSFRILAMLDEQNYQIY